jgi:uncharacterized membrane protein
VSAPAVESVVARVLKVGLAVSAVVIAAGLGMQEFGIRHLPAAGKASVGASGRYPRGVAGVVSGLGHGSGSSVLEIGLALLVCTPVAAVAAAAISYRRRGEGRFALVGGIVLLVLAVSSLVGLGLF